MESVRHKVLLSIGDGMPLEGLKVNTVFYLPAIVEVKIPENNFIMISPFRKKGK